MKYIEYSPEKIVELRRMVPRGYVSKMSGIPLGTLTKLERGEREPGLIVLRKLGEYFGVRFY